MRVSTKGRYGLRVALELALRYGGAPIPVREIAEKQGISEKYMEHLISILRNAGLVKSVRGAHGGYTLSRHPSQITLLEIIEPLEGELSPVECVDDPEICRRADVCVSRDVWKRVKEGVEKILRSMTLQDLVDEHNRKVGAGFMYYI